MIIEIRVTPRARREKISEHDGRLTVYVTALPERGKANKAVVKLLAEHFGVPQDHVRIVRGGRSRSKVVEIK